MCSGSDFFLCLLSILFPPIGVWIKRGIWSADSLINILLCMLGYLPGLLHAWYIISVFPQPEYSSVPQDQEGGRYDVWYVTTQGGPVSRSEQRTSYGTMRGGGQLPGQQQAARPGKPVKVARSQAPQPPAETGGPSAGGANQDDDAPPPPYAQVVQGDHKVQSHD